MFSRLKKFFDPTHASELITEQMLKSRNFGLISISVRKIDGEERIVSKFMGSEVERSLIIDMNAGRAVKESLEENTG